MPSYLARLVLVAGLVSAAAGLTLALPRWAARDLATVVREARRGEAMALRLAEYRRVSEGKHQAIGELIAGRLTLVEAAAQFRELDAAADAAEESLCRQVLGWVETELQNRPDLDAVVARLSREYRAAFGRDPGPRHVPQPR